MGCGRQGIYTHRSGHSTLAVLSARSCLNFVVVGGLGVSSCAALTLKQMPRNVLPGRARIGEGGRGVNYIVSSVQLSGVRV